VRPPPVPLDCCTRLVVVRGVAAFRVWLDDVMTTEPAVHPATPRRGLRDLHHLTNPRSPIVTSA
jgi:hypothetical protein